MVVSYLPVRQSRDEEHSATRGIPPDEAQLVRFLSISYLLLLPPNHGPLSSLSRPIGFALTDGAAFGKLACYMFRRFSKLNLNVRGLHG